MEGQAGHGQAPLLARSPPAPQGRTRDRCYSPDCLWRRERLIVELHSARDHGTTPAISRDAIRDRRLLLAGWRVIHVTWAQLVSPRDADELAHGAAIPYGLAVVESKAVDVDEYLAELEPGRCEVIGEVLAVIRANLPAGLDEGVLWGMPCWYIPLERYPDTYNGEPLGVAALAAQKRHYAVYLNFIYSDEGLRKEFEERYRESGKRMDVGKSCVRFTKLENLPLDVIGWAVAQTSVEEHIARYEESRA